MKKEEKKQEKQWIPVADSTPEHGKECYVKGFSKSGKLKEEGAIYYPTFGWFVTFNGEVTHWCYKL